MKSIYSSIFLIFIISQGYSQCDSQAFKSMDTPRASFLHQSRSTLWWDGNDAFSEINDPTLSSLPADVAFAGGLWLGALDPAGNLIISATTYNANNNQFQFQQGPIVDPEPSQAICELFNRIWEVSNVDINAHQIDWSDNQVIDNLGDNIRLWPGRGNEFIEAQFGIALPDMKLAPFIDLNNNGTYEPDQGDYPDVYGAQIAHWWMFNDRAPDATYTSQIGVLAFSFDNGASETTTYYYEYEITNRANMDFQEMYLALWVDPDLGCHTDDYIGCKPENQLAYVYNQDQLDGSSGNSCEGGVLTFDIGLPIFGITVLDGTDRVDPVLGLVDNGMSSFGYYNNGSINDPNPATIDPNSPNEFWNVLQGKWRDGTPMTQGGSGYDPASSATTNYAFPDDPDSAGGWSMCTSNLTANDRRMVIGSGPFALAPGQRMKFAFAALVTGATTGYPCPSIDAIVEASDNAKSTYSGILNGTKNLNAISDLSVHPNPTTSSIQIGLGSSTITSLELYDVNGSLLISKTRVNQQRAELSLNQFPAGIYWIKIQNKQGQQTTQRVVKL